MNHSALCICIGADVHLDEIVLCVVDKADGHEVIEHFRVTNNLPGAQAAATAIAEIATHLGCTHIEIGWEATGMLWIPFHRYLSRCPQLQPFERELVCFTPQLVSKFKDGLFLRRPKNDKRDASTVPARLRGRAPPEKPVSNRPAPRTADHPADHLCVRVPAGGARLWPWCWRSWL